MTPKNPEESNSKKDLTAEVKSLRQQIVDLKKAEEERKYAYKLQRALYKISDTVNSVKNLSELFNQVHKIVNELTKANNFYIALYDKSSGMISFPYFIDEYDSPPDPMKIGQGLTSYVIKTGKPLLASPDTFKTLVKEKNVINLGTPSVDWLGVPLKDVDNTVFGVMVVQSYVKRIRYGEEDKKILTFISSQVAMAIKRKNLEEALKKSEEKYRSFSNQLPLGVYRTTEAGNFLFVNQALVNILDYKSIDEFLKKTAKEFYFSEEDRHRQILEWKKRKTILSNVFRFKTKKGRVIWIRDTGRVHLNHKGDIDYIDGIIEDITERKQTEESLKESEEKYRTLFETMVQGVVYQNKKGEIISANKAAERILGVNILEMKGKKLRDLQWKYIYEDGSDFSWENHPPILALKTSEEISNVVMGLCSPSGKYTTWININSVPQFHSGEKKPYQVYSTFFDITEQKKAETIQNVLFNISQLTIQTLLLSELIKEIHQQVGRLMDSRNFYVALVYDKNKSLFTFPYIVDVIPEELIEPDKIVNLSGGFTNYILKKESPLLANKFKFQKMLDDGEVTLIGTEAETWLGVPLITPTGEVIGVVVIQSYEDSDAYTENDLEVLVIISRTIAWVIKFKQTEAEKFELKEKLQRSEKMEALGRLAGGVAHDLNNVLNAIVGYPDLILNKIQDDSQLRRLVFLIRKSGEKAAAIVDDLLTLARRGVPIKEVVSLNLLIDDYLKSPECKKLLHYHSKVKLKTYIEDDIFRIKGSLIHLSKMIMNLISNAAEAMIEGGDLNISLLNCYIDRPKKLYDGIINEGNYVLLKVSDCGVGISSKDLIKIFEPFYTKKVMGRSGTGLGMAVVWGTVKDHIGHIHLRSKEGAGTTFEIYLPITREEISQQYKDMKVGDYMGKGESILVVDDIQEQREIATTLLSSLGYSVDQVSSGEEAIKYIKSNRVDLLLLDMIMEPGLDGLDTFRCIKKINPDQKAVIVSGFSETERIKEAQSLGVGKYVKKPYSLEKIGVALRIVLDS